MQLEMMHTTSSHGIHTNNTINCVPPHTGYTSVGRTEIAASCSSWSESRWLSESCTFIIRIRSHLTEMRHTFAVGSMAGCAFPFPVRCRFAFWRNSSSVSDAPSSFPTSATSCVDFYDTCFNLLHIQCKEYIPHSSCVCLSLCPAFSTDALQCSSHS